MLEGSLDRRTRQLSLGLQFSSFRPAATGSSVRAGRAAPDVRDLSSPQQPPFVRGGVASRRRVWSPPSNPHHREPLLGLEHGMSIPTSPITAPASFHVRTRYGHSGTVVVAVAGEVDMVTAPDLHAAIPDRFDAVFVSRANHGLHSLKRQGHFDTKQNESENISKVLIFNVKW